MHPAKGKVFPHHGDSLFQNFALVVLPPGFVAFDLDDRLVKEVFRQLFFPGHVLLDLVAYERQEVFLPLGHRVLAECYVIRLD